MMVSRTAHIDGAAQFCPDELHWGDGDDDFEFEDDPTAFHSPQSDDGVAEQSDDGVAEQSYHRASARQRHHVGVATRKGGGKDTGARCDDPDVFDEAQHSMGCNAADIKPELLHRVVPKFCILPEWKNIVPPEHIQGLPSSAATATAAVEGLWMQKVYAAYTPFPDKRQHADAWYRLLNQHTRGVFVASTPVDYADSLESAYPEVARSWVQSRMGFLLPRDVHAHSYLYVWWSCAKPGHADWPARINSRTKAGAAATGCPTCSQSKLEKLMAETLAALCIKNQPQKTFPDCVGVKGGLLKFDFFLPGQNVCIEMDGMQHFEAVGIFGGAEALACQKVADATKTAFCARTGLILLRVAYTVAYTTEAMALLVRQALDAPLGTLVLSDPGAYHPPSRLNRE